MLRCFKGNDKKMFKDYFCLKRFKVVCRAILKACLREKTGKDNLFVGPIGVLFRGTDRER